MVTRVGEMVTTEFDVADIHRRVDEAIARVRGRKARLIGFEAVEIQRFVAASSRPITIQGACETLKAFDEKNGKHVETIFAGGARGLMLIAEDDRQTRIDELKKSFAEHTVGLSLALADVPFDHDNERDSLKWLWLAQRTAHDACEPEPMNLADFEGASCADCRARPGHHRSPKPDAPDEKVCRRCFELIKFGRKSKYAAMDAWTLEDVSEDGLIGVVSADGNKLGKFFRSLHSLKALAAGSRIVNEIFNAAHRGALDRLAGDYAADPEDQRHIAPITGGDDIKVFLMPTSALDYVDALMHAVEQNAKRIGNAGGLLTNEQAMMLANLGIGVGLAIAPYHVPATRLVDFAHELEDEAKHHVKKDGNRRSAVCFSVHRVDGTPDDRARQTVDASVWPEFIRRARLLRQMVPNGQRAAAAAAWELDEAERENQLLYQIARSYAWRNWYDACGVRWDDRHKALGLLSMKGLLALAGLGGRRGRKKAS